MINNISEELQESINDRWEDVRDILQGANGGYINDSAIDTLRDSWENSWKVKTFLDKYNALKISNTIISDQVEELEDDEVNNTSEDCVSEVDLLNIYRQNKDSINNLIATRVDNCPYSVDTSLNSITYDIYDLYKNIVNLPVFNLQLNKIENLRKDISKKFGISNGMKLTKAIRKLIINKTMTDFITTIRFNYIVANCYASNIREYLECHEEPKLTYVADTIINVLAYIIDIINKGDDSIKVVLSVDPVDIITASYITTGWNSCFNIMEGCYRTAPIAILGDHTTCLSYAYKTTERCFGTDIPVKLFRMWVYLVPDSYSAVFGRTYPHAISNIEAEVRKLTADVLNKVNNSNLNWIRRAGGKYNYSPSNWIYKDSPTNAITLKGYEVSYIDAEVGLLRIPCLDCGDERRDYTTETLKGECCSYDETCSNCGCGINEGDVYYDPDGNPLCCDCYNDSYTTCFYCGETIPNDEILEGADGYYYCEECFDNRFFVCEHCGETYDLDESCEGTDGCHYCEDCFADLFFECECCEELYDIDDSIEGPDGKLYCRDCYDAKFFTCNECGDVFCLDEGMVGPDSIYYCEDCYNEKFFICENCEEVFCIEDAVEDDDGNKYCPECADTIKNENEEENII